MSGAAGGSTILREFLLKLGYSEDEQSRRKFTDGIKHMTETVAALGAAMIAAAAGVVAGVKTMAEDADRMYFVSQRTKASAANIRALESAFEGLGGTAGQARAVLEKLGDYVRASPGNVKYLEALTGAKWHDAATGMEELSEAFKKQIESGVDISVVFAEATRAGLSQADVLVLLQKDFRETAEEYRHMAEKIIGDSKRQQEIVENAHQFMRAYSALSTAVNDFAVGFGDMLGTKLKPSIDKMREYLEEHSVAINTFLEAASKWIINAIEKMIEFGEKATEALGKLYQWYQKLTPEGKNLALAIGGVATAIFLLNTAIGSSPVVRLLALAAGLVTLYEDYEKWEETGKTGLINWAKWKPGIEAAIEAVKEVRDYIVEGVEAIGGWKKAFEGLVGFVSVIWAGKMLLAVASVATALAPILAVMAVFAASAAAGYSIAHAIDESMSNDAKAAEMADQMKLEAIRGPFGLTGYKDKSGKTYSVEELAAMHTQRRGVDSATQAKSAREGYDQYIAMGASPEIAAAMIAQEKRESGFDSGAIGDNGQARGLYQHHADRRAAILAGTGIDMATASAADQRRGAWWELHHGEKAAFDKMMQVSAKGGRDAAGVTGAAATTEFERPADRAGQGAIGASLAREYYDAFAGKAAGDVPSKEPESALGKIGKALAGIDLAPALATQPALAPGAEHNTSTTDDHRSVTQVTNHINLHGVKYDDPKVAADVIAAALSDSQARLARNNTVNVK